MKNPGPDPDFIAWAYVKQEFRKGDDGPLWAYVDEHPVLQPEQSMFIADIARGVVKKGDGRRTKGAPQQAIDFYEAMRERGFERPEINEAIRATQGDSARAAIEAIRRHVSPKPKPTKKKTRR